MPGLPPLGLQNLVNRASQGDPSAIEMLGELGYDPQGNPAGGPPGGMPGGPPPGMAPGGPMGGMGGMAPQGGPPPMGMPPQQSPGMIQQMIRGLRGG